VKSSVFLLDCCEFETLVLLHSPTYPDREKPCPLLSCSVRWHNWWKI